MLKINKISKSFNNLEVLRDLKFNFYKSEYLSTSLMTSRNCHKYFFSDCWIRLL